MGAAIVMSLNVDNRGLYGAVIGKLIVQNHVEQSLMRPNAAVVINKAELAETIHEVVDARSRGADHFRETFLRYLGNQLFRFTWLAKLRHQQEYPRQMFFAGVEELVDKIGLDAHTTSKKKFDEYLGEGMFLVHHTEHFLPLYLEGGAVGNGSGSGHMQRT